MYMYAQLSLLTCRATADVSVMFIDTLCINCDRCNLVRLVVGDLELLSESVLVVISLRTALVENTFASPICNINGNANVYE